MRPRLTYILPVTIEYLCSISVVSGYMRHYFYTSLIKLRRGLLLSPALALASLIELTLTWLLATALTLVLASVLVTTPVWTFWTAFLQVITLHIEPPGGSPTLVYEDLLTRWENQTWLPDLFGQWRAFLFQLPDNFGTQLPKNCGHSTKFLISH